MDESRELIEFDKPESIEYYKYCFCLKSLYEMKECSCRYISLCMPLSPCFVVADTLAFIPQCILNNIKLCLQ